MTPSLKADYLASLPALDAFYPYPLAGLDYEGIIKDREKFPVNRTLLADVLTEQYRGLKPQKEVTQNIALLRRETTFTITTGQQPGLYLGPMYVLYKAASAIRLCRELKAQQPDKDFVPVFWVASEDHDYLEVNHTYLHYDAPAVYSGQFQGAVGRHSIAEAIHLLNPPSHLGQAAYTPGKTWGSAFRELLHALFGAYGLVILDPDDAHLKAEMIPLWRQELFSQTAYPLITAQTEKLEALGYPAQIHPRPINLFYLTDDLRARLERHGSDFVVVDTPIRFTATELEAELATHPERFSPNVVLRPVYQERLLPNLAYIGGWAEVAYWGQLKAVFAAYRTFFPAVIPRMSALLVPEADWQAWSALGLTEGDLTLTDTALISLLVRRHWGSAAYAQAETETAATLEGLAQLVAGFDPGQGHNIRGARAKLLRQLQRSEQRLLKALHHRNPTWAGPALALRARIQPEGLQQERLLNWQALAPAGGVEQFIDWLVVQAAPGAYTRQLLQMPQSVAATLVHES